MSTLTPVAGPAIRPPSRALAACTVGAVPTTSGRGLIPVLPCPDRHKVPHRADRDAQAAADCFMRSTGRSLRTYRCRCGFFHLTRNEQWLTFPPAANRPPSVRTLLAAAA